MNRRPGGSASIPLEVPMQFRLLGPLSITDTQGRDITPTAPKLRAILALLVLRRNQIVCLSEIADELWGPVPPRRARSTMQTYAYNLRRIFEADRPGTGEATLRTEASGYRLAVADEAFDLYRFEQLTRQGQQALTAGHPARAAETLTRALALWRGPALADVPVGTRLTGHLARLREGWLTAV